MSIEHQCSLVSNRPQMQTLGVEATQALQQDQTAACCADHYIQNDVRSITESIVSHVEYTLARNRYSFNTLEAYQATAYSLRDRLIQSWNDTQQYFKCGSCTFLQLHPCLSGSGCSPAGCKCFSCLSQQQQLMGMSGHWGCARSGQVLHQITEQAGGVSAPCHTLPEQQSESVTCTSAASC